MRRIFMRPLPRAPGRYTEAARPVQPRTGRPRRLSGEQYAEATPTMAKRASRAATAQETLRIQLSGGYTGPGGQAVSIAEALSSARDGSVLYTPRRLKAVVAEVAGRQRERGGGPATVLEVVNEPTLR